jgi:hypothetical protein
MGLTSRTGCFAHGREAANSALQPFRDRPQDLLTGLFRGIMWTGYLAIQAQSTSRIRLESMNGYSDNFIHESLFFPGHMCSRAYLLALFLLPLFLISRCVCGETKCNEMRSRRVRVICPRTDIDGPLELLTATTLPHPICDPLHARLHIRRLSARRNERRWARPSSNACGAYGRIAQSAARNHPYCGGKPRPRTLALTPFGRTATMPRTAMTEPADGLSSAFSEPAHGARRARSDNRRIPPEPPAQRGCGRQ